MSTVLKPYSTYAPSPVPWLDDVPAEWSAIRLDRLFRYRSEEPLEGDARVTGYLDGRVTLRSNVAGQKIKGVVHETGWQRIHVGDFAISGMNAHLGGMGVSDSEGKCSPIYLVLEPREGTNAHFVSLAVRHAAHLGAIKALVQTIRFNSADMKRADLKSIYVPLPPPEEQAQIVRFIRHLDQRVNRLIKTKRRLIELLNEQKQAIIHRAVTRGLDPTVPLKPSGIEGLADIPSHWEVKRLKFLFREFDRRSTTGEETLLSLRMYRGLVPHNDVSEKPIEAKDIIGFKHVEPGVLVMNRMQASNGLFGIASQPGLVSPDYATFVSRKQADSAFFMHLFRTNLYRAVFRQESKGLGTGTSGFLRLYTDRFGAIHVPVPPVKEQGEIVAWLHKETLELDTATSKTQDEIDFIREYRSRLVADVVTGQLDVRNLDLPEVEESLMEAIDADSPEDSELSDEEAED